MRRGPGSARAAIPLIACLALLAAGASATAAGITPRVEDGALVFTSRPRQKPGTEVPGMLPFPRPRPVAPAEIARLVSEVSGRYEIDPRLITTVISVESGFNQMAVSPKGARGLMQLMPETARRYGVRNVHDPRENVEGGVSYLRDLMRRYGGDTKLALAAYNAGPDAVERAGGVPEFQETRDYIRKIESRYGQSLTLSSMGSGGGTRPIRGKGSIRVKRDESGGLLVTNAAGPGMRVVRKSRDPQP